MNGDDYTDDYTNLRDLVSVLGNGDFEMGCWVLHLICCRIGEARGRRPAFADNSYHALGFIEMEFGGFREAIFRQSRTGQVDKALDMTAALARFINREYGEYVEITNNGQYADKDD